MKTNLIILAIFLVAFSSCATMYKSGQTPDDVYYSPARSFGEAVATTKREPANDEYYNNNGEDRMIRMGITDYRWRYLNNDYSYSPYAYYNNYNNYNNYSSYGGHGYYNNYNPYYSNFYSNYYYNPYYSPYPVYITPAGTIKNSTPRMTNLSGYNQHYNNTNSPIMSVPANRPRPYNNSNGRVSGLGNALNKVFSPSNNNNNNSYNNTSTNRTTTERTYTPPPASSNSSSSGSSSSGSSGGRITRPN